MINLHDITAANNLLMSLGADDAMPRLAAVAIERSLELQHRVDRALKYAAETPPNSMHARQLARILDGSITLDDEMSEVPEDYPAPRPVTARSKVKGSPKGKLRPGHGLEGRSAQQRIDIRAWIAEQGFDIAPSGRIPQQYLDAYDETQEQMRRMRAEQSAARQIQQQPAEGEQSA